jgi:phosphoheptose isomerase
MPENSSIMDKLFIEFPQLKQCRNSILKAAVLLKQCYAGSGKVLICGNGGSAADSEHIVGELMKGFIKRRKISSTDIKKLKTAFPDTWEYLSHNLQGALPAISLVSQTALSSAFINDVAADMVFAQQVYGYGKKDDILIGLSTSGNSSNVLNAVRVAKAFEIVTICMTGESGGMMKDICDVTITVPAKEVYKVQEYHLPVYHALCTYVEDVFFKE